MEPGCWSGHQAQAPLAARPPSEGRSVAMTSDLRGGGHAPDFTEQGWKGGLCRDTGWMPLGWLPGDQAPGWSQHLLWVMFSSPF